MFREVQEETEIRIIPEPWPVVAAEETTTGFVQYVFLGARTPTEEHRENWEGRLRWLPFAKLEGELTQNERWVPSGKLHLLLWLAAGAPGAPGARFGDHDAHGLLRVVLEQVERDGSLPFWREPKPRPT